MKKILLCFVILIILLVFIYSFNNNNNNNEEKKILLGYCPTMKEVASKIALNNNNINIVEYQSTIDVLNLLNKNEIDIALVGRIAKSSELKENFSELMLDNGFTLVNQNKNIIYYRNLNNIKIHTYLNEKEVKEFLGNVDNVVFYEKIEDINQEHVRLIDWKDYNDNYELIVVIDEDNLKIEKFRIPVLYSYNSLNDLKIN